MDLLQSSNNRGFPMLQSKTPGKFCYTVLSITLIHSKPQKKKKKLRGVPCFREKGFCVFFPIIYRHLIKLGN